jgi:RNA polymerase sigma factor (sigma-70 family)
MLRLRLRSLESRKRSETQPEAEIGGPPRSKDSGSRARASRTETSVDARGAGAGVCCARGDPKVLLLSDPDLLGRFRSGDRRVLSKVYWFYLQRVESYLRRGLSQAGRRAAAGIDGTVADLVQEVFVHAFAASARLAYDGRREYGRLLVVITRNALIDHLRRQNREELVDPLQLERLLEHDTSAGVDESTWTDPQLMAFVQHYVAKLPEREYAVYVERYAQDKSQLRAADDLGLTRQQVRTLEQRVRGGLVRELARAKLDSRAPASFRLAAETE